MAEILDLGKVVGPHFTPVLDEDGNLSWTNDGGLENPPTQNIKGPEGGTKIIVNGQEQESISFTDDPQKQINEKQPKGNYAILEEDGKIPSSQLPSFVDDVIEYDNKSSFPLTGESGKIYVAKDTNLTYRWSGTTYVEIGSSLALGYTSSTAYPGNEGQQNKNDIETLKEETNNIKEEIINLATTKYVEDNYIPKSLLQSLYWEKIDSLNARLVEEKPSILDSNFLEITTNNTTFDFATLNKITITKVLATDISISNLQGIVNTISFAFNRNAAVEFAGKVYVDNTLIGKEQTFAYIQSNGDNSYSNLNELIFTLKFNNLNVETKFNAGQTLKIEIFTKQNDQQNLITRFYCGVNLQNIDKYCFSGLNLQAVEISSNQIADNSITENKLSVDLLEKLSSTNAIFDLGVITVDEQEEGEEPIKPFHSTGTLTEEQINFIKNNYQDINLLTYTISNSNTPITYTCPLKIKMLLENNYSISGQGIVFINGGYGVVNYDHEYLMQTAGIQITAESGVYEIFVYKYEAAAATAETIGGFKSVNINSATQKSYVSIESSNKQAYIDVIPCVTLDLDFPGFEQTLITLTTEQADLLRKNYYIKFRNQQEIIFSKSLEQSNAPIDTFYAVYTIQSGSDDHTVLLLCLSRLANNLWVNSKQIGTTNHSLTISQGSVNKTFDGSKDITVEIESGSTVDKTSIANALGLNVSQLNNLIEIAKIASVSTVDGVQCITAPGFNEV